MDAQLPQGLDLSPEEQTFHWFSRPYAFLKQCAQRYGDTFTLEFKGLGKHVVFSDPASIQEIFSGDPEVFHAGEGNAIIKPFLGTSSLLLLDGAGYKRHRKLMLPAFHPKRVDLYAGMIQEISDRNVAAWTTGLPFSIHARMLEVSLEIILRVVFGADSDRLVKMKEQLVSLLEAVNFSTLIHTPAETESGPWSAWERFRQKMRTLELLIREELAVHRGSPAGRSDVLTLLLKEGDAENAPLTDDELRDELVTLLIAGHETTATALSWAFHWVNFVPEARRLLVDELDALNAKKLRGGEYLDALQALPYLDACVKETLRITPVIPVVSRRLTRPATIGGIAYAEGTHLMPCIYLVHHRKELYPSSDTFRPERFLERRFSQFEYLPFGGGVRRCLGMSFGHAEMKIILASAFTRFTLQLETAAPARPVRRSVVVAPSGGVRVLATSR